METQAASPRLPGRASTGLLIEFLEVAISVILYERRIYPESIFAARRAFGVPVKVSRHPEVNAYVSGALRGVAPLLDEGAVARVVVAVVDEGGEPLERFVFALAPRGPDSDPDADAVEATEYAMRALLANLALAGARLPEPREDASFRILVETRDDAARAVLPFLAAPEAAYVDASRDVGAGPVAGAAVVPVRRVATALVDFALHVEVGAG